MSHDDAFAAFQARREEERAAAVKITWRKVSPMTGGGWSALGKDGALGFVNPKRPSGFDYGLRDGKAKVVAGTALTLARAKAAVERLLTESARKSSLALSCDTSIAPTTPAAPAATTTTAAPTARKEATVATTKTQDSTEAITAEQFAGSIEGVEAVRAAKAPTARLRANGKTLAYADDRKGGFVLSIAAEAIEPLPAKEKAKVEIKGRRATLRVTPKNAKGAAALVAALAKRAA